MQELPTIFPSKKFRQKVLGMTIARFYVDHLQDGHNIRQEKFSITVRQSFAMGIRVKESEDAQLAPDPGTCIRLHFGRASKHVMRDVAIA